MKRMSYGEDKMLYPKIKLDISVKKLNVWMVIFNPYAVYIAEYDGDENVYNSKMLSDALAEFMVNRFPNSSYLEKRRKYFKDAEMYRRLNDYLITVY